MPKPGLPSAIPRSTSGRSSRTSLGQCHFRAIWQSGLQEGASSLTDRWVFGAGPFSYGTIRRGTELAGEPLPKISIPNPFGSEKPEEPDAQSKPIAPGHMHAWINADSPPPLQPLPAAIVGLTGAVGVPP